MFVTLTDVKNMTPVLVNLDKILYAYRPTGGRVEASVLVFGKVVEPQGPRAKRAARVRDIGLAVVETLPQIQEKRRMASG